MSKPKRRLVSEALAAEEADANLEITSSRDSVIGLHEKPAAGLTRKAGSVRHGYRTTLYLPREAQFKIREIALMKRCKPHDVLIEAMADLFERYNAGTLAEELRSSRDSVIA
ncbi:hypothetical protein K9U33_17325 [Rhodoblastus acidophilus]|uniref:hypothetical protein n=1 Tax=Candidatus Rhodoblastus alkanivorans TaxID=2954117 RepID=UPI001FAB198F|nr:hypothetical protein [Candidatus Rhodoblastus alkanivorans]MCI4680393.1 hypothetical protein [Candidatus Rhodoblastus alkanivorans]